MAITFSILAALATAAGGWIVRANQYGRIAALVILAVFGLTLLWPALADRLSRPFVQAGSRLAQSNSSADSGLLRSLLLGVATGLLWALARGRFLAWS